MRPLGQTRPLLAYGVPAAAGLAVGGALAAQGEDPGSAALGGVTAALGARGGLGAARLAGKYAAEPVLKAALSGKQQYDLRLLEQIAQREARSKAEGIPLAPGTELMKKALSKSAAVNFPQQATVQQTLQKGFAAGLVPSAAGIAGLGGVALGAVPGAIGVPGFQQGMAIDPESPGSSNTASAKYGVTPYASTQYM
jgi:hypothetical protein